MSKAERKRSHARWTGPFGLACACVSGMTLALVDGCSDSVKSLKPGAPAPQATQSSAEAPSTTTTADPTLASVDAGAPAEDLDAALAKFPAPGTYDDASTVPEAGAPAPSKGDDPLSSLQTGDKQLALVCARNVQNAVTRALCKKPTLTSLESLQVALGLDFKDKSDRGDNDGDGNPGFALLGHSSSLVMRFVNAINPRAVVFKKVGDDDDGTEGFLALGFTRGDQFVELAAIDSKTKALTFYLVRYEQACNAAGCTMGDLLTPKVERNWTGWSLYQDEDLKNTTLDCRQCHQPGGPASKPLLRFQELRDPWTHVIAKNRRGGRALLADFRAAHGTTEDYGPIPAALVEKSDGQIFENFIRRTGFGDQPNEFRSGRIENEVRDSQENQPEVNDPPGTSRTWQELFTESLAGKFIPVPYHDVKVTSPSMLSAATTAYKAVLAGTLDPTKLPDIRNIFIERALGDTSIMPISGIDGRTILKQMCQQCHNPNLDQTISRAKFDVTKLDTMSKAEKQLAMQRLQLPRTSAGRMPPTNFKDLRAGELQLVLQELAK